MIDDRAREASETRTSLYLISYWRNDSVVVPVWVASVHNQKSHQSDSKGQNRSLLDNYVKKIIHSISRLLTLQDV
jgi:hypothetical protein